MLTRDQFSADVSRLVHQRPATYRKLAESTTQNVGIGQFAQKQSKIQTQEGDKEVYEAPDYLRDPLRAFSTSRVGLTTLLRYGM